MLTRLLSVFCAIFITTISTSNSEPEIDYNGPTSSSYVLAAQDASDALDEVFDNSPYIYLIIIGLCAGIGGLLYALRVLWLNNKQLQVDKDTLQDSKLIIALSSSETVKEAIHLISNIHEGVTKLNESDSNRRFVDIEIENHLKNISKVIEELRNEIRRSL